VCDFSVVISTRNKNLSNYVIIWFSFALTSPRFRDSRSISLERYINWFQSVRHLQRYRNWLNERVLSFSFSLPLSLFLSFFPVISPPILFVHFHTRDPRTRAQFYSHFPPSNLHNEQSRGDLNFESEEQTPRITQTKLLDESVNMAEAGASKFLINLNSATMYISSSARWSFIEIIFLSRQGIPCFNVSPFGQHSRSIDAEIIERITSAFLPTFFKSYQILSQSFAYRNLLIRFVNYN